MKPENFHSRWMGFRVKVNHARGIGSDGGVEGINRRLPALRQVAAADPDQTGNVMGQVRALLQQPEVVIGAWRT